jgi:hypothetical protein
MSQQANFGTDWKVDFDLDSNGTMVSGTTIVFLALLRRWQTPRGRLLADPNYGFNVLDEINDDVDPVLYPSQFADDLDAENLKDPRVASSQTSATYLNGVLNWTTIVYTAAGPFTAIMSASSAAGIVVQSVT